MPRKTTKAAEHRFASEHFDIDAHPAKAFFVWMITRDIDLADAILDLLDNCVDGARRTGLKGGDRPFAGYTAEITFSESEFIIKDNCGGIPRKIAEDYAFKMGRPDGKKTAEGTVGVYGIGMKRAIFKMGTSCRVKSQVKQEAFEVRISPAWLKDDNDWVLPADTVLPLEDALGTEIKVDILHRPIARHFKVGSAFREEFPRLVSAAMSVIIDRGFSIVINGQELGADLPSLLWTPAKRVEGPTLVRPYFYRGRIDQVDVFLSVGFREKTPLSSDEPEQATGSWDNDDAGWSIACNDRIILSCDRTRATGWETRGVPRYHAQFRAISGFIEFHAEDPKLLPMPTTKRGVDASSSIYQHVLERMTDGLKYFTAVTNEWKGAEEELNRWLNDAEPIKVTHLRPKAERELRFAKVRGKDAEAVSAPSLPERQKVETTKRISFVRPIPDIQRLAEYLFDNPEAPPNEVGISCFERVLKEAKS